MPTKRSIIFLLGAFLLITPIVHVKAQSPVASFTFTPETPLIGETVIFDASASYDPNGTIVSYTWDFGDGTTPVTSPESIIDHTYTAEGNYTVTLNVTDNEGLSDTESKSLMVINYPVARFSYAPAYPIADETVTFDASESTPNGGTIANYSWNFGDGTEINVTNPITTHIYTAEGNYTIALTVFDSEGLTDAHSKSIAVREYPSASFVYSPTYPIEGETVTFNASESTPDGGTIIDYSWDFGDGTNGTGIVVANSYDTFGNFTVTLTITDSEGLTDNASKRVRVRGYPVAYIEYTPLLPLVNETVTFDASLSTPNGGTLVSYTWDFGDGSPITNETDPVVDHFYTSFGAYNVTLTVMDSEGLSATSSSLIRILIAPAANFTYSPSMVIINETVIFDASASYDPDGVLVNYSWNFGDGNTTIVSNSTLTHIYTTAGIYNVTLTVTDDDGLTDRTSKTITVYTFIPVHDVAVIQVEPSTDWVYQGHAINITVVVANEGTGVETFNVTLYHNNVSIGTQKVVYLTSGKNATLTFCWNTTGVPVANHIISATAGTVPGETDKDDNTLVDGTVDVLWLGDVDHNGLVDMRDIYLIVRAYASQMGDPRYKPDYDLNADGTIDMKDLYMAIKNFLKGA